MEIISGFGTLFTTVGIIAVILGTLAGLVVGALPGLTSTMALAVLAPLTFGFETTTAICFLMGIYIGGIAGGCIPAICLNIPGTPASAATTLDGYPMVRQGRQKEALRAALISSGLGTALSCVVLVTVAPAVAAFGLKFSGPEYFALGSVGLIIVISVSGEHLVKGIVSGLLGLLFAFVGIDAVSGSTRFTFGIADLSSGLGFVPAIIGLFGLAEVIHQLSNKSSLSSISKGTLSERKPRPWRELMPTQFRATAIGTLIGSIPGAGADIASWVSYDVNSKFAKKGDRWGNGEVKGVVASEAGNNANVGGALIPMTTFGIPGDGQTAMLIAFLLIHGLNPGPALIHESGDVVYAMFASVIVAGLILVAGGRIFAGVAENLIRVPTKVIYPIVVLLCIVGSYALSSNPFSILVMFAFGILGWFMIRAEFPVAPMVLAMILCPIIETNLRRGLVLAEGDFFAFFERPIVLGILCVGALLLAVTIWLRRRSPQMETQHAE
jgi:putative tricarboxylic transport membrane protein